MANRAGNALISPRYSLLTVRLLYRLLHRSVLRRPGGHSEEPLPDPIPNSAVKVLCADGTKSQGLEE